MGLNLQGEAMMLMTFTAQPAHRTPSTERTRSAEEIVFEAVLTLKSTFRCAPTKHRSPVLAKKSSVVWLKEPYISAKVPYISAKRALYFLFFKPS